MLERGSDVEDVPEVVALVEVPGDHWRGGGGPVGPGGAAGGGIEEGAGDLLVGKGDGGAAEVGSVGRGEGEAVGLHDLGEVRGEYVGEGEEGVPGAVEELGLFDEVDPRRGRGGGPGARGVGAGGGVGEGVVGAGGDLVVFPGVVPDEDEGVGGAEGEFSKEGDAGSSDVGRGAVAVELVPKADDKVEGRSSCGGGVCGGEVVDGGVDRGGEGGLLGEVPLLVVEVPDREDPQGWWLLGGIRHFGPRG